MLNFLHYAHLKIKLDIEKELLQIKVPISSVLVGEFLGTTELW
jgi:hypothetical protein